MYRVDIFADTSSHSLRDAHRAYGCILACRSTGGTPVTLEIFGGCQGTYHHCFLAAIIAALGRMKKNSKIYIHGPDDYVLNMIQMNLETWAKNSFKDSKGKPLKDGDTWKQVWELLKQHEYYIERGRHEYSDWLTAELKKKALNI